MASVTYSKLAEMDLVEIWQYIAEDSPMNADKFVDYLDEKCHLLARNPASGGNSQNSAKSFSVFR